MKYIFTLALLLLVSNGLHTQARASAAVRPIPSPTSPLAVMEMEGNDKISSKSIKSELNKLGEQVKYDDTIKVVIIYYSGRIRPQEASLKANQAKNYLIRKLGIESKRILAVNGGSGKTWKIRVYFVPVETVNASNSSDFNTITAN